MKKQLQFCLIVLLSLSGLSLSGQELNRINDLKYNEGTDFHEKQQLDLYLPKGVDNAPLILWIHGGAWAFGDRKKESDLATQFVKEGIAVAVVSYRLSPGIWADPKFNTGIQHPEHIKDIAAAFKWLYEHASEYGYARDDIFVSGYSAGGHLSALLAADKRYLAQQGLSTDHIRGIIPIAGAYDITHYHEAHYNSNGPKMAKEHVEAVFGNTKTDFEHASPTSYIHDLTGPIFLISERQTYNYTMVFERALREADTPGVKYLHVRELDHKGLYQNLAQNTNSEYRDQIVSFIRKWSATTASIR